MVWQRVGEASWESSMVSLMLVVIFGALEPRVGPWLQKIIRLAATRTGTVGGPAWTGVGLHTLYAWPVHIELGSREGYRPGGRGRAHFSGGPLLTVS